MIFPVQGATAAVNSDNVVVTRIDVAGTKIKGKKKKNCYRRERSL